MYSNKRRSKLELVLDVLMSVSNGQDKPTRIMYECNMSWVPVINILNRLVKAGNIEVKKDEALSKNRYYITDEGMKTIRHLRVAGELLKI